MQNDILQFDGSFTLWMTAVDSDSLEGCCCSRAVRSGTTILCWDQNRLSGHNYLYSVWSCVYKQQLFEWHVQAQMDKSTTWTELKHIPEVSPSCPQLVFSVKKRITSLLMTVVRHFKQFGCILPLHRNFYLGKLTKEAQGFHWIWAFWKKNTENTPWIEYGNFGKEGQCATNLRLVNSPDEGSVLAKLNPTAHTALLWNASTWQAKSVHACIAEGLSQYQLSPEFSLHLPRPA